MNTHKHMSQQAQSALLVAAGFGGCDLSAGDFDEQESAATTA